MTEDGGNKHHIWTQSSEWKPRWKPIISGARYGSLSFLPRKSFRQRGHGPGSPLRYFLRLANWKKEKKPKNITGFLHWKRKPPCGACWSLLLRRLWSKIQFERRLSIAYILDADVLVAVWAFRGLLPFVCLCWRSFRYVGLIEIASLSNK